MWWQAELFQPVAGSAFGAESYRRISFATSMENLEKALDRVRQVFEGRFELSIAASSL